MPKVQFREILNKSRTACTIRLSGVMALNAFIDILVSYCLIGYYAYLEFVLNHQSVALMFIFLPFVNY